MRVLLWVVAGLAVAWAAYWVVGSRTLDSGARAWFEQQAAEGREAGYADLRVAGFPYRFDLTIDGLRLADPASGTAFDTPMLRVYSLAYRPWHIIAALAPEQTLTLPGQTIAVASDRIETSVVMVPGRDLALDRLSTVGRDIRATSSLGWTLGADEVRFATRRDRDDPLTHEIGLEATRIAPDPRLTRALAEAGGLPDTIDRLRVDAFVTTTAPLDRNAAETRPQVARIDLRETSLAWGVLTLTARGELTPDAAGLAQGRIALTLRNWRVLPPALVAAGIITEPVRPTVEAALATLAAQSPDPETLAVPLDFRNGWASLGPLPLGPAPRLRERP